MIRLIALEYALVLEIGLENEDLQIETHAYSIASY